MLNKLKEKYSDIEIDFTNDESVKILEYTEGSRVKTAKFGNKELARSGSKKHIWIKISKF